MHLTSAVAGSGVTTTQAFDPNTGLVQSILAGTGNSVSNQTFAFDTLGRLTSRGWLNTTGGVVKENSCFDGLNRLTGALITSGSACTGTGAVTMTYDALGNITSKSDICATAGCFAYGGSGAGPHALTSVTGVVNGVTNPTFAYDANRTMTSGAGRTIAPTTFNMAASMTSGANTVWFGYDPDHARYKMVSSGLNAGTTYYLNDAATGAMEEREVVAGVTTWRDYIMADGMLIAQRQCVGPPPCSTGASMLYFILDHLGSVTVVTDGSGSVLQRLSYDAWGKRRNADGSALSCTGGLAQPNGVSRGFTGQEMIDALCLVNLNARVYDPTLGRFLSADPVVGDATIPQELNRFSYVLNDPLSLTDPSGLCFLGCFWKSPIFRDVLAIAVAVILHDPAVIGPIDSALGIANVAPITLGFINAGIAGGVSGLISSGGSLKGAALGALEADLFQGVGNELTKLGAGGFVGIGHVPSAFISHGLVGGLMSELRGGSFGSGFLAGGVGSLAPVPAGKLNFEQVTIGTAEASVLGGAASVLGGGKFENGAETGAFGYLFNAVGSGHALPGGADPIGEAAKWIVRGATAALEGLEGAALATESLFAGVAVTFCGDSPSTCQGGDRTIFRAIGPAEYDYLMAHGNYGSSPSQGGKYFAQTLAGAQAIANNPIMGAPIITSTTVPLSVYNQGEQIFDRGAGAGPAVHFSQSQLPMLYESMTPPKVVSGPGN